MMIVMMTVMIIDDNSDDDIEMAIEIVTKIMVAWMMYTIMVMI